jgi:hypothetical protein
MRRYIHEGRSAAWQKMSHIRHLLAIERALNAALSRCVYTAHQESAANPPRLKSYDEGLPHHPSLKPSLNGLTSAPAAAAQTPVRPSSESAASDHPAIGQAIGKPRHRRTPTANGAWSTELLDRHLGDAMRDPSFAKTYGANRNPTHTCSFSLTHTSRAGTVRAHAHALMGG